MHVSHSFRPSCIRTSNVIRWYVPVSGGEGTRRPPRLRTGENTRFCLMACRDLDAHGFRTGNRTNRSFSILQWSCQVKTLRFPMCKDG